ncbi:MAG TPA: hypothetical protein VIH75_03560 [Candidatus Sulfotelmatobacter sp.]
MTTLMGGVSEKQVAEGGVSRHTFALTLPPNRFYCVLDELPLHLIPQRSLRSLQLQENRRQPLYLNPECILCTADQIPDELAAERASLSGFALAGAMAWVRSRVTGNLLPFWLGPQLEDVLEDLRPNEAAPSSIPERVRCLLASADILIPHDRTNPHDPESERRREDNARKTSLLFREKGYAPLADLIHPFHIAALRRYYRYLIRTGAIRLGDGQSPRRYVAYNEPVARFFHRDIAATLSAVAGQSLKPSYVYLASYLSGAELKKHTDREQCEFSVTLCLDFSPEPTLATPWPIRLDTPTGTVTVYQALGDGLAYRGTRLAHYRDNLPEGQTSTSIFFHYVATDFAGSLD